jgi:uncharacterized membrane protein YjjP (DUF1212 family)
MDYNMLLDTAVDIGYRLAMCGAETYRVEESISRILAAYEIDSEIFAIPNCIIAGIKTAEGVSLTRIRRIGFHGNDLDGVERYNRLSRRICAEKPDTQTIEQWINETESGKTAYRFPFILIGNMLAAFGFSILFGGTLPDSICAAICGCIVGLTSQLMGRFKINLFFSTMFNAGIMAFAAYAFGAVGVAHNTDTVVIGGLMLLVPGLLITNAMRDIIFGDTNSGINRIVQVFLIAAAIALGTGVAWNAAASLWGVPINTEPIDYGYAVQIVASLIGCLGFSILFNIHGSGFLLCVLGGGLSWAGYCIVLHFGGGNLIANFFAAVISAVYSESMARIRKYPAISYLVVSIMPMIPGAGIYYTTMHLTSGNMTLFAEQGARTIAVAGLIAVGILLISTLFRVWSAWRQQYIQRRNIPISSRK